MPDKKLTDNEIVQALECCMQNMSREKCKDCPLTNALCRSELARLSFDLINRLQAEIERLENNIECVECELSIVGDCVDEQRAEAIKEFAEKANEIIDLIIDLMFDDSVSKCQLPSCHKPSNIPCESEICIQENKEYWHSKLDNLLKELVGEDR